MSTAPTATAATTAGGVRRTATSGKISWDDPVQRRSLILLAGMCLPLIYCYGNMLWETSFEWFDPQYSHGYLIPVFSLVLLWLRAKPLVEATPSERWAGLGILMFGLGVRMYSAYVYMVPLDRLSFLVSLVGVFVIAGGWSLFKWSWPAIGFLVFMYPLPSVLENSVLIWMQNLATQMSQFVFQVLGYDAVRSGNTLTLSGHPLLIAEACSGLRMTTIFVALAVAVVMLINRPWWDKVLILLSSIPIALLVNMIRITVTGLLLQTSWSESETFSQAAHDVAGYVMPILALGFLWLELAILSRLSVVEETVHANVMGSRRGPIPGRTAPGR